MKTINNILKSNHLIVVLLLSLLITSCGNEKGNRIKYPVPEENPVYFTSEAGTKNIYVENITGVHAENPQTEIIEYNDTVTETEDCWIIIANDWIRIRYGQNDLPNRTLGITVKENTSDMRRFYSLGISGSPGGSRPSGMLTIVQEAR